MARRKGDSDKNFFRLMKLVRDTSASEAGIEAATHKAYWRRHLAQPPDVGNGDVRAHPGLVV